jgi:hypothetical protein
MANSCLSTAARAALRLPCPKFSADAAGTQLQLQLQVQYASVFPRPARAHQRLVADHLAAPALPVARRRGLAVTAMVSHEEAAATAVEEEEEVAEGQLLEQDEVAEQEQPEQENDGAVEASSDNGGPSEAPGTTTTKLYFGNLPYNCDSAQLAGIVQEYATPEMVEVRLMFTQMPKGALSCGIGLCEKFGGRTIFACAPIRMSTYCSKMPSGFYY